MGLMQLQQFTKSFEEIIFQYLDFGYENCFAWAVCVPQQTLSEVNHDLGKYSCHCIHIIVKYGICICVLMGICSVTT